MRPLPRRLARPPSCTCLPGQAVPRLQLLAVLLQPPKTGSLQLLPTKPGEDMELVRTLTSQ